MRYRRDAFVRGAGGDSQSGFRGRLCNSNCSRITVSCPTINRMRQAYSRSRGKQAVYRVARSRRSVSILNGSDLNKNCLSKSVINIRTIQNTFGRSRFTYGNNCSRSPLLNFFSKKGYPVISPQSQVGIVN